jgi:anaerobic ribonucleoside-triphosphate reductase activating protein
MKGKAMIRVNKIVENSLVDGPGIRTVVFLQGCSIHCSGCQNNALWSPEGGSLFDESALALILATSAEEHGNVTISGGEPFDQVKSLALLCRELRNNGVKNIIVYSGYTFEQITNKIVSSVLWVQEVLSRIDVLVDGPFIKAWDDPFITYRGSRNQRAIDVPNTLNGGGRIIELIWDDEIQISPEGNIVGPVGIIEDFEQIGAGGNSRMCGQTRPIS